MSSTGIVSAVGPGRGLRFPRLASVFINRATSVAGGVYMLCEDAVQDSATVTAENSNSDIGTLANVTTPTANSVIGMGAGVAGGELATFILALESAAIGVPILGVVEAYYIDALVTTTATRTPRTPLYPTTGSILNNTPAVGGGGAVIGAPAIARILQDVGTITSTLTKVHFCGLPGGFAIGPGTT